MNNFIIHTKQNLLQGKSKNLFLGFLMSFFFISIGYAQKMQNDEKVLDEVIATIGKNIILQSDLESAINQYMLMGYPKNDNLNCLLFEELMFQKLLIHQADVDSVVVTEEQVQAEIDNRLRYYIQEAGSPEKLEERLKKSIVQLRNEFHDGIQEQLLAQTMQSKITSTIKVTPSDIKEFYSRIPKDSLPYINAQIQVAQIVKKPIPTNEEKEAVKNKLYGYRKEIVNGKDFGVMAVLYSQDKGSAMRRGELGFMKRETLVAEFAAVAFKLKPGEISEVVETEYGYHIIQLIERRGEEANLRHILLRPEVSVAALQQAKIQLDSLKSILNKKDTISFEKLVEKNSDDKDTRLNGGLIPNSRSGNTFFDVETLGQVDPGLFFAVDRLNQGDVSEPLIYDEADGSKAYRLVKLVIRKEPHIANLRDDYQNFQQMAMQEKQKKALDEWINKSMKGVSVKINDKYTNCKFANNWLVN